MAQTMKAAVMKGIGKNRIERITYAHPWRREVAGTCD